MLQIHQRVQAPATVTDWLELPFQLRQKSRLRVMLQSGKEAALFLERGLVLRGGDLLKAETGEIIAVIAAEEPVLLVRAADSRTLSAAAYHLGNRHVPLQIGDDWLRLEQDHVLKDMLLGLGLTVTEEYAPFEPEAGAYGGGHRHGDAHAHSDALHNLRPPARMRLVVPENGVANLKC